MAEFTLKGGREVRMTLQTLAKGMRPEIVAALKAAMQPVHDRAVAEAPKRTGNLADHVFLEVKDGEKGAIAVDVGVKGVSYANPLHYGAPAKNIPANPFLTRAFDAEGQAAANRVEKALRDHID